MASKIFLPIFADIREDAEKRYVKCISSIMWIPPPTTTPTRPLTKFYDPMTVHRNRLLVNKTNRCTEFQFYWYYYYTCFGQSFCPSSAVLSLHRLWYILCSCDEPFATRSMRSILLLVANGHHNCIKCTKTDVLLITPDDRQKECPKHVES